MYKIYYHKEIKSLWFFYCKNEITILDLIFLKCFSISFYGNALPKL